MGASLFFSFGSSRSRRDRDKCVESMGSYEHREKERGSEEVRLKSERDRQTQTRTHNSRTFTEREKRDKGKKAVEEKARKTNAHNPQRRHFRKQKKLNRENDTTHCQKRQRRVEMSGGRGNDAMKEKEENDGGEKGKQNREG